MRLVLIIVACAAAAFGQRHKIEEVNAEKPEGKLLQQIMQENDAAKKTALLDQFAGEFPKHDHALGAGAAAGHLREGQRPGQDHRDGRKLLARRSRRSGGCVAVH